MEPLSDWIRKALEATQLITTWVIHGAAESTVPCSYSILTHTQEKCVCLGAWGTSESADVSSNQRLLLHL